MRQKSPFRVCQIKNIKRDPAIFDKNYRQLFELSLQMLARSKNIVNAT